MYLNFQFKSSMVPKRSGRSEDVVADLGTIWPHLGEEKISNALTLTPVLLIPDVDHRSHFGSRYTSGCCDLASLLCVCVCVFVVGLNDMVWSQLEV